MSTFSTKLRAAEDRPSYALFAVSMALRSLFVNGASCFGSFAIRFITFFAAFWFWLSCFSRFLSIVSSSFVMKLWTFLLTLAPL